MDEPTAAISVAKIGEILKLVLDLKSYGKSVILVSHRLEDILEHDRFKYDHALAF